MAILNEQQIREGFENTAHQSLVSVRDNYTSTYFRMEYQINEASNYLSVA